MSLDTTTSVPVVQFPRALAVANQMRREAVAYRDQAVAGSVRVMDLETGLLSTLKNVRIELMRARTTPNMATYAITQRGAAFDMDNALDTMITEIDATLVWLEANFPKDAGGRLLAKTFVGDGSGQVQSEMLTDAAVLTALTARLDALIATID